MLDDRPILQRSLIGFGAFSFVFTAAMAGSAFMISGGFDLGGRAHPTPMAQYESAAETAWNDFAPPAYAGPPPAYAAPQQAAYIYPEASEPAPDNYYATNDLDGAVRGERVRATARSEEDILRDIEREFAESESFADEQPSEAERQDDADYSTPEAGYEPPAYSAPEQQPGYDPYISAAKEQAAAGDNQY